MYPVSDAYLAARRSRVREERITGGIKLKDGTIITVDDSVIIQNSLSVSKKVCSSGKFDIGTVNCSVLEMKLVDDSAYDHEFGGALIRLKYGIVTGVDENGNKVWEEVPLPPFFADGSEVTRKWNVVSITAYDPISLLNMDYPDTIPTTSLYAALGYVCARAGLGLAISEEEFNSLPNSSVIPDFSSSQIESCLDVAMWIAQTVNCCGFVDYRGLFDLKQYKYTGGNNYDRLFTEDEIKDIKYSDTRTYLAYLQAYVNGKVKLYSKVTAWTGTDASHTKEGALSLPNNPILSKLTESEQAAVNSSYLENRSYPTRYIKMTGWIDPALELMDVVAFSGKMIDVGQIINVATQIKWCYGKCGSIYCASVSENAEPSGGTSAVSLSSVTESDSSEIKRLQPKSQIQKRVDAIEAELKNSSGSASALTEYEYLTDLSAKLNGVTYTAEKDETTGLISKISDDAGNEFEPTITEGLSITDTAFHNAVFMAVAMCRGFGKTPDCIPVYNYAGVKGFNPEYSTYVGLTSGSNNGSYPVISDDVIVLNHWCSDLHYNHLFALTAGIPNKAYSKLRLDIETTMAHSTWNHCLITVATGMNVDELKPNTDNGLTDIIVKKYLTCWSASIDPAPNISLPRSIVEIDISQSIGKNVYVTFRHNCCDVKIYSIALIK